MGGTDIDTKRSGGISIAVIVGILVIALGGWLYVAFSDPVVREASITSSEALVARVTGDDECSNQPIPDAAAEAPSMNIYHSGGTSVEGEYTWQVHHLEANCVIVDVPLPLVTDQKLIIHDDPLIYDHGKWSSFYYKPAAEGAGSVTITASGPGGTTVVEGPIETLLSP